MTTTPKKRAILLFCYGCGYGKIITLENPEVSPEDFTFEDDELMQIVRASVRTFRHNNYDLPTDCASRERAGYLCDGFFTARAEKFFTGDNKAENLPIIGKDTNTELSYQAYLKADRLEEGKVFIDYLWKMRGQFKRFAREFYGVKGLMIPSCATIEGKAMGGWAHYSLSPTMTIWTAQSFDEYYLYTGDVKFLKTRAFPFFKYVGDAILGILEEKNGKLYFPLSSSPEIYDDTRNAYLTPNSNFDLSLLIYLYKTLCSYCSVLGIDDGKYRRTLEKLDEIAIDDKGVILFDKTERLPESHRHFSHLMALYPLHLINYDSEENKRVYHQTLLHLEQLGTGWWVGFSFAMSAQIYAMAKNGNSAYERLRQFALGFVADNGFHLNGDFKGFGFSQFHYRPFTLESVYGFADAIHETLMQDNMGFIDLLPAVSTLLGRVSFKKMRSRGGVLVSCEGRFDGVERAVFESKKPIKIKVKNNFNADALTVDLNGKTFEIKVSKGEVFSLDLIGKAVVKKS